MIFEYIDYNEPLIRENKLDDLKFFEMNTLSKETISKITERPVHEHTKALADEIEKGMRVFELDDAQIKNIEKLKNGHRVIIGGQQAGLLMSPMYILHKIISLFILQNDVKKNYDYDAIPVFWIAGEDHDYEEVNHTHVYDKYHNRVKKISYKSNLTVPMSIGFYDFDKKAMKSVVDEMFNYLKDEPRLVRIKDSIIEKLEDYHSWTDFFTSLVHELFKDKGLLIVNAHSEGIRELEKEIFKKMFLKHEKIDKAFRSGQEKFTSHFNVDKTIDTETNVHLFINSNDKRALLKFEDGIYRTEDEIYTKDEILKLIDSDIVQMSNNVVTRPVMQECLFNTLIFVGGGAEVKYWGELHEVFETLEVPMPLVLKRMEFMYLPKEISKKLDKYKLTFTKDLISDLQKKRKELMKDNENSRLLKALEKQEAKVMNQYDDLKHCCESDWERQLIESNYKAQMKQVGYLKRRYKVESMRKIRNELSDLKEIEQILLPFGVLQERIYHPLTFYTQMWDYSPLTYHENLVLIKE
ncbi:bacillithiol biosynthesis cysteine-adding enzyme BshC [Phocicoccus pinnipedialis]|uniref:Putative cysteine ligase BshC n=1 Tax=Phocicoccus pinnipedialis TaxID=110845 RepID=A0A6V7RGU6_9BACL|nr:bacillithiol biosynthesis cysteine-adding enzyme BshC [Jeotgalicoccus pinnipedialis]MBP1939032.1 bacillithiol biosynthesis cysteine-adding enzyme BshC [Jeotgalicoccus pinnipedialis]CAD2077089.1 Putative cysteine ligase BshC [Jeotgalicoccus pinnipedialis]